MTSRLRLGKLPHQTPGLKRPPSSQDGPLGIIIVDPRRRIVALNPAAESLLHIDGAGFVHRPLAELVNRVCTATDAKRTMEAVQRALLAEQVSTFELQLSGSNTVATFVKVHVSPMRGRDTQGPGAAITLENITAYKQVGLSGLANENARRYAEMLELAARLEWQKEQYRLQSIHDGLTGIYNYGHFQALLRQEVARARRYEHPLALLMLDIDDFKSYNDAYGHPAGDQALRDVATILRQTCRQTDWVARYGGEEFALILSETHAQGALTMAERVRRAVERESRLGLWFRRPLTVSIGVAAYPEDADNPQELIVCADERLYQAKAAGKNRVCGVKATPATA